MLSAQANASARRHSRADYHAMGLGRTPTRTAGPPPRQRPFDRTWPDATTAPVPGDAASTMREPCRAGTARGGLQPGDRSYGNGAPATGGKGVPRPNRPTAIRLSQPSRNVKESHCYRPNGIVQQTIGSRAPSRFERFNNDAHPSERRNLDPSFRQECQ